MARLHSTRVILPLLLALLIAGVLGQDGGGGQDACSDQDLLVSLVPSDCPLQNSTLAESICTASRQCSAADEQCGAGSGGGDSELAQTAAKLSCMAQKLGITSDADLTNYVENFTDDADFIRIWQISLFYLVDFFPASLTENNQQNVFVLSFLDEILSLTCAQSKDEMGCVYTGGLISDSRCSLGNLVPEETLTQCLSVAQLNGEPLPENWWLSDSALSCNDLWAAAQSSLACALTAAGMRDGDGVSRAALETAFTGLTDAAVYQQLLDGCLVTDLESFVYCWSYSEPTACITYTSTELAEALQE